MSYRKITLICTSLKENFNYIDFFTSFNMN